MSAFLGTHLSRRDAKGRISVPAPFRTALRNTSVTGTAALVLRLSHKHPCIEAWPEAAFQALAAPLDRLDLFSEEQDDLAAALYSDAWPVEADREGRIVLPEAYAAHASLGEQVAFLGLGRVFQIWEPEAAERRRAEARENARNRNMTLPGAGAP